MMDRNTKSKFNAKAVNRLMLALIGVLIIAALAGTYEITGLLKTKSAELVDLKAKSQALTEEQSYLISAKQEVARYASLQQITESIVPQDKDQAQTVLEIVKLAQQNNISLTGISFPASTLGSPSVAANSTLSLSQLTPVKGIPGVYVLPITINNNQAGSGVGYSSFYNFLTALEQNRRTSQVTGLSIQPQPNGYINFSLTINVYIKPQ
ncbi:hypothetical protein M1512_03440 [Patescibacteria group bacterium]|nr:hypothetical protein [Patescibacteria group bacterium]